MQKKATVSETLRRIFMIKGWLEELTELRDKAFAVFDSCTSITEMDEICKSSWKKLCSWNIRHDNAPRIRMQLYTDVEHFFFQVTRAWISRDDFKKLLDKSCEAIEECIKKIQTELSEEEKKLDELYKEFALTTGNLKFIFEEDSVKELIIEKFLKM